MPYKIVNITAGTGDVLRHESGCRYGHDECSTVAGGPCDLNISYSVRITDSAMTILQQLATQSTGSCPVDFMTVCHTARYGARLHDLREAGLTILKSRCEFGPHNHQRYATRYHLVSGDGAAVQFVSPSNGFVLWQTT